WRRGFDDSISLWRANAEAAWAEVSGRSEADYQRLDAGREELVSRWQEAEERWRQLSGELSGLLDGMAERLAGVERQNTGTAEELRRAIDDNAASLRSGITETAAELRAALEETDSRLQRSLDGTAGRLEAAIGETDSGLQESLDGTRSRLEAALEETGQRLRKSIEDMALKTGQKALEESDRRIEDYRTAQALQFRNLEQAADDVARLEGELRRVMEETEDRVRQDFALFESAAAGERSAAQAAFDEAAEGLRGKLAQIERDVEALKSRAYENVSEKLNLFEEDFAGDLVRRGDAIQEKLDAWQEAQGRILLETGEGLSARWQQLELSLTEDIKTRLAEQRDRMEAELERLKTEADAFETGIRDRMAQGDESLESFKAQITENLAGARSAADAQVKTELGRFSLSMAENLKHARRELEEWQEGISAQIKETTQVMEDLRRKSLEFSTDSDERLASVRSSIAGVNRQIQEFVDQTGLFDQAEKLKTELERRIEDLRGDMDGLDQRRAEAAELENQFTRIKRLEDEVNAKMTRFLSEQRRIELMEADFNRLLQTSQAVEEKLGEVSSSDDLLQAIQVQLRKINDALAETEEKYNRVEKKNQTLETINLGVDRNFKALRETEGSLKALTADLGSLRTEQEQLRQSLEELRSGNEQARAAAERLSFMEQDLSTIEERIKAMQVAREWIAQAETRMQNLNHDMQDQIKLMGEITREEGDGPLRGSNPESIATRENVHKLHRQGWKDEEIAKTLRLSIGEVKLILEVPSRRGG
ncbi:MAG: hypothetical protein LBQ35_06030, partial [Spirochaetaceae bacterium]|nr:hypothetical protein [Spirochaetaceae bacterium]